MKGDSARAPDFLVNAERSAGDKPAPSRERDDPLEGYWLGSAAGRVEYWRRRALAAEAELKRRLEKPEP